MPSESSLKKLNHLPKSSMAIRIMKTMIYAFLALFFLSSTFASSDAPFIVAHKKATLNRLKSGVERVSISIDIYNQGSTIAYDVSLTDDSWPQDSFDVVSGNTSKSWERLDAGTHLSHSFELDAKTKGIFYGAPAVITFRIPTKAAFLEAYSTPIFPLDILSDRPPVKKLESVKKMLARYGSQVSVITIIGLFVYLVSTPSKSGSSKGGKKKR